MPYIGMRKIKSVLAIFIGFCLWQLIRVFLPELEVHPLFVYMYGLIEIRETSAKTKDYGRMRIKATFVSVGAGIPLMFVTDWLHGIITGETGQMWMEIAFLTLGALLVLELAEKLNCGVYCGLAAGIYVILLITHFEESMYLYSIMRALQTIMGVGIAYLLNVKLLPYPAEPGTLSYYLEERRLKSMAEHDGSSDEDSARDGQEEKNK